MHGHEDHLMRIVRIIMRWVGSTRTVDRVKGGRKAKGVGKVQGRTRSRGWVWFRVMDGIKGLVFR